MRKLRVGIIGCGTIAESQAMAASQLKNTQLVAVCDRVEDNVNSFAEKYNVPRVFTDYKLLLQQEDIDAI